MFRKLSHFSENCTSRKIDTYLRVYEAFRAACEAHEPKLIPPSFNRFCLEIHRRSGYNQTLKREGKRVAIQKEVFYWQLEQTTPRHGDRPFEIVHIDHTPLDIELLTSLASISNLKLDVLETSTHNLGSPWVTYMVDAYSRRLLAVYMTYEEPSYRSCMMVLRICVKQFRRMPQTIVVDNGPEFDSIYFDQLMARYRCTKKHRPPAMPRFGSVQERLFGTTHTQFIYELEGNTQIKRKYRQVTKSVDPKNHAKWTLSDLYEALHIWAYQIYDKRQHPSLGQSPREAFDTGIALGGSRNHIRVEYDNEFRILTLPAPERGKRKVQPSRGVKIHNIYYWSNEFRNSEIEKASLEVRYDPFDMGIAYALVKGQWVKCISEHYQYLQGRSEKEIRLISAEIYERKRQHNNSSILSDRELVQFLNTLEAKEGDLLKQQLRASENRIVLQLIEGGLRKQDGSNELQTKTINLDELSEEAEISTGTQKFDPPEESELEILEYYGEF